MLIGDAVLFFDLQCHGLALCINPPVAGSIWCRWFGKVVIHQRSKEQLRESFHFLYRVDFEVNEGFRQINVGSNLMA